MAPPPSVSPSGRRRPTASVMERTWPPLLSYTQPGTTASITAAPGGWQMGACGTPSSLLESAVEAVNLGSEPSIGTATRRAFPRRTLGMMSTASEVRAQARSFRNNGQEKKSSSTAQNSVLGFTCIAKIKITVNSIIIVLTKFICFWRRSN